MSDNLCPVRERVLKLEEAFPDLPEVHKLHREHHQALIEAADAQKRFWEELSHDLKKTGVRAVILIVLGIIIMKLFGEDAVKLMLKSVL